MKPEDCALCRDLRVRAEFRTPGELTRVLQTLRERVRSGALLDLTQPSHSPSGDFAELPDQPPWPDYVEHYFRCSACPWRFRLAVDTDYGRNGSLEGSVEPYR